MTRRFLKIKLEETGQGLVEYALILVLVAIVVIAVLLTLGPAVAKSYCKVAGVLEPGSCVVGVVTNYEIRMIGGGSNLQVHDIYVTEDTTVTVSITDTSTGNQTNSTACVTGTPCAIVIAGVTSGSGTITSDKDDNIPFTYP